MYHSPVYRRSPPLTTDDEDRLRRDNIVSSAIIQQHPTYDGRSPTHARLHSFSPTNGSHPPATYTYSSRPSTSSAAPMASSISRSPRLGPPPSPTSNGLSHINKPSYGAREQTSSTYYDPTSEHRDSPNTWNTSGYNSRSAHPSPVSARFPQQSPTFPNLHAHPSSRHNSISQSPIRMTATSPHLQQSYSNFTPTANGISERGIESESAPEALTRQSQPKKSEDVKPTRTADPMAFSSILSSNTVDPPKLTVKKAPPVKRFQRTSKTPNGDTPSSEPAFSKARREVTSSPKVEPGLKAVEAKHIPAHKKATKSSHKDNEKVQQALAEINAMELSDVGSSGWTEEKEKHKQQARKRLLDVEDAEASKRKRRRTANGKRLSLQLDVLAKAGREGFLAIHEDAAIAEVQQKEITDEKERKKDMQRKRRREKTVQQETQKQIDAIERAQQAADIAEREKFLKEASRAEKKAKSTKRILEIGDAPEEIREVTPITLNLEGGTMGAFQTGTYVSPEPPKKRQAKGPAIRPKKSKEKKQAEKDAAEAGYAAMQQGELNLAHIAPKEENRRETLTRETKETKETKVKEPSPVPITTNYASKGYQQIYDQIWKDAARKDISKVYRIKENSLATKQSNMRKTAQLAAKEARRWQLRTNKSMKDVQARAKRSMREMMNFWKRNERVERDLRRTAEKQELDNARKAEADREANRQKRKLNFLLSQTEIFSHFIGNKVKTDEVERSTDRADVATSDQTVQTSKPNALTVDLPDAGQIGAKVTNFEDLDFDAEDETVLRQAAMANAQNAVQQAQDRARAFNAGDSQPPPDFDEGEMNFQNPSTLGTVEVSQPAMLTAQLKEYQLKGLNWLVNLYNQGINGILADEMGLGKTVQSISVMAHLAESASPPIWGPFLVVAPSSTLHNWQQEITRFVPDMKVLPYWGTAKDRKVLRKFWDRKQPTYTKESQFHVMVTSYQLIVQDVQYFQKIKWQYMILDEAQAIKSSSSSRWKCLLGLNTRSRLLLTGTPIQNNMQELWALLHFIMPDLFDSHDEFNDWFSKDIESHAQSNTKLNEDQLKRLHLILKPFMLRRIKKHVQKELGDKIEEDVFCDLTYRQRAYYGNLRNRISIMDLIERYAMGDDQDTSTLMNLVMQFRKVCNHPDLFERADTTSPFSFGHYAETASFLREGALITVGYSTRNLIEFDLPRLLCSPEGRLDWAGPGNEKAGSKGKCLTQLMNIWSPEYIHDHSTKNDAFTWLRFSDISIDEAYNASHLDLFQRAVHLRSKLPRLSRMRAIYKDDDADFTPTHALFNIVEKNARQPLAELTTEGRMYNLLNISKNVFEEEGLNLTEQCARPSTSAPPIQIACSNQDSVAESQNVLFNISTRRILYGFSEREEQTLLDTKVEPSFFPTSAMLPPPLSDNARYTNIQVPSMRRFVTDSGKLAKLDELLRNLKNGGHRVLLYFQMTRMIDLMEEYLTYRNYKYCRLDGSTKLEDRRDTVHDFQTRPEIFIFLLSTRAGGLGINLTSADTVIFYDSDWNPTIDSQAMDRAHRLGQTRQVTVYRMITRGTIEERIRKRALQKEEVQRVVISGGSGAGVDFNTRSKDSRGKEFAMWLADDEQAELIEQKEKEIAERGEEVKKGKQKGKATGKRKDVSLDDMYHEGEGVFEDGSNKPSGAATPIDTGEGGSSKREKKETGKPKSLSKKAKTARAKLAVADAEGDLGMGGM